MNHTTTITAGPVSWTRCGDRHVCTGPAGLVGWYQHTGYWWGAFTPGRAGWSEQLAGDETTARQLVERTLS